MDPISGITARVSAIQSRVQTGPSPSGGKFSDLLRSELAERSSDAVLGYGATGSTPGAGSIASYLGTDTSSILSLSGADSLTPAERLDVRRGDGWHVDARQAELGERPLPAQRPQGHAVDHAGAVLDPARRVHADVRIDARVIRRQPERCQRLGDGRALAGVVIQQRVVEVEQHHRVLDPRAGRRRGSPAGHLDLEAAVLDEGLARAGNHLTRLAGCESQLQEHGADVIARSRLPGHAGEVLGPAEHIDDVDAAGHGREVRVRPLPQHRVHGRVHGDDLEAGALQRRRDLVAGARRVTRQADHRDPPHAGDRQLDRIVEPCVIHQ